MGQHQRWRDRLDPHQGSRAGDMGSGSARAVERWIHATKTSHAIAQAGVSDGALQVRDQPSEVGSESLFASLIFCKERLAIGNLNRRKPAYVEPPLRGLRRANDS